MYRNDFSRREYLAAVGTVGLAGVAGCSGNNDRDAEETDETPTESTGTQTSSNSDEPGTDNDIETVSIVAGYPVQTANGTEYRNTRLVTQEDITEISSVQNPQNSRPYVRVTLTESAAREYRITLIEKGFTAEGIQNCRWQQNPEDPGWCLYTVVDGERRSAATMTTSLATTLENADAFINNPTFRITMPTVDETRQIRRALAGDSQ